MRSKYQIFFIVNTTMYFLIVMKYLKGKNGKEKKRKKKK